MSDDKSTGERSFGRLFSPPKYGKRDDRDYSYITEQNQLEARGEITQEECNRNIREFLDKLNKSESKSESKEKGAVPQTENKQVTLLQSPVTNEQYLSIPGDARDKFRDDSRNRKKELVYQINIGKISREEAQQTYAEYTTKLYMETVNKSKGAVPKQKSEIPKVMEPKKKQLPLNKKEKFLYKHLNTNKISCLQCRKLIERLLNERTRINGAEHAENHLTSSHGVKIMQQKSLATPTIEIEQPSWDNSAHSLSLGNLATTQNQPIGGIFPLQPPEKEIIPPSQSEEEITEFVSEYMTQTRHEEDDGAGPFIVPKKTSKRKATSPLKEGVATKNPYQSLTETEDEGMQVENEQFSQKTNLRQAPPKKATGNQARNPQSSTTTGHTRITKEKPPPPLIVQGNHGKSNFKKIQEQLNTELSNGYTIKYSKNNIIIYAKDIVQYKQLKQKLAQDTNTEWHTYALEEEKTHAFVAKGLDNQPDINEIKQELEEIHKIEVIRIYPMQTKYRMLYLIITSAKTTLKDIKKIKHLNHIEVNWELRRKFTEITQCKKCYRWGHSATYCSRSPRCPICGESHQQTEETCNRLEKCANCGGDHKATDVACNVYKYRTEKLKEMKEKNNTKRPYYRDAEPPNANIWQIRKERLKQMQKNPDIYSTDDELSEDEAAAFPPLKRQTSRQTSTQQRRQPPRAKTSENLMDTNNVSELLNLAKEFHSLGNKLTEAVRFLADFLAIFKKSDQADRATALLNIMVKINEYDF